MQFEQYFPFGIAKGQAFIGRESEAAWLQKNLVTRVHTLLMAPRRYGKSSLALMVLGSIDLPFIEIDLQLCRSAKSVEKKLISGVEQLISGFIKESEKALIAAKNFFKKANKHWTIGLKGLVQLTIEPEQYDDVAENILLALQFLEAVLENENKEAIIFIDEIQEIMEVEKSHEIQGAIRHFAQKAKRVSFVFSGSNRRLLRLMFEDSEMPLYQLCDVVTLEKISAQTYHKYLSKIAKKTWKQNLDKSVIDEILKTSQRHPRRTNNLCLYLWRLAERNNKIPGVNDVKKAWKKLIYSQLKGVRFFLSKLSTGQLKVLTYIAMGHNKVMTSKVAQRDLDLSATTIAKSIQLLDEADLIDVDEDRTFNLIDPIIKSVLTNYETEILE